MNLPLVSIIVSAYKGEKYLAETLDSILMQKDVSLEVVLIDDASSDQGATRNILDVYMEKFENRDNIVVVRINHEENLGPKASYQDGIEHSGGLYFKILDHDDTLTDPHTINRSLMLMQEDEKIGAVYSVTNYIDDAGEQIGQKRFPCPLLPFLHIRDGIVGRIYSLFWLIASPLNPIVHGSGLIRRECWDQICAARRAEGKVGYFDQVFAIRVAHHQHWSLGYLNTPSLNYRIHPGMATHNPTMRLEWKQEFNLMFDELFADNMVLRFAAKAYHVMLQDAKILVQRIRGPNALNSFKYLLSR